MSSPADSSRGRLAPVFWPALIPNEAPREWEALRRWVDGLRMRYPNLTRVPECWWRHNELVEVFAALRDFERASFDAKASAKSPIEWQRALRDMEIRMDSWIKRFACAVPGRGHDGIDDGAYTSPSDWDEFLRADVARRRKAKEEAQAAARTRHSA